MTEIEFFRLVFITILFVLAPAVSFILWDYTAEVANE
jgi:hypothetical protein